MKTILHEATWYGVSSLCALMVDVTILWVLVQFFSVDYLIAAVIAFLCGATIAYALSVRFAFQYHRLRDRRAEFAGFVALGIPGLVINAGAISIAVKYLGLHYLLGKCLAASITFACNFVVRRHLLFLRRRAG
jgi:putative flippase GtrA